MNVLQTRRYTINLNSIRYVEPKSGECPGIKVHFDKDKVAWMPGEPNCLLYNKLVWAMTSEEDRIWIGEEDMRISEAEIKFHPPDCIHLKKD